MVRSTRREPLASFSMEIRRVRLPSGAVAARFTVSETARFGCTVKVDEAVRIVVSAIA